MTVRRIFVEIRQGFDIPAQQLCDDLKETFHLDGLEAVRIINRYDIEGLSDEEYEKVKFVVFAEAPVDKVYEETLPAFKDSRMFAVEYLPGQYDQTADSAAQCVQLVTQKERPQIATARVIVLTGEVDDETLQKIKDYCINAVESREASLAKPESLDMVTEEPADVEVLDSFNAMSEEELHAFMDARGFAMSFEDLKFCQEYFRDTEHRAPTITELRVIDTYWSDHCRHTTFTTAIDDVTIEDGYFSPALTAAYRKYKEDRDTLYGEATDRAVTLMDIAVIGAKALRKEGLLDDLDKSEEINACSIVVKADIGGKQEDWLVMFKNETHNHPTEIEPFGGAATCLGGAIRDPLSGRDGCGGATGSSKEHTEESLTTCGAEVQKGNPPTERKIQRLFRNPKVSRMIKRCNDFGAGGVAVAIGELADGLVIDLDAVKKKYKGLDGTELAISESQERMAVVLDPKDVEAFQKFSDEENLEATPVAVVTEQPRLIMKWRGNEIVQMNRAFLDTNGVRQHVTAVIAQPDTAKRYLAEIPAAVKACGEDLQKAWLTNLQDLNVCSQKGLAERFDSTIGGNTVLMPFGGKTQLTPAEGMVAKLPVLGAETTTATAMTFGLNPAFTEWSPFHGALYSVVEAAAKMVALGGDAAKIRLTFQEYFESLGKDPAKWGNPFAALIGALWAQHELGIPAIGGKDSMSGTFEHIHVPPTLAAFAVDVMKADAAVSPEFKQAGSRVYIVPAEKDAQDLPVFPKLRANFEKIRQLTAAGKVRAAQSIGVGGIAAAVTKMTLGNGIGFAFAKDMTAEELFCADYGTILLELADDVDVAAALADTGAYELGQTTAEQEIRVNGAVIRIAEAEQAYTTPLEKIFPTKTKTVSGTATYVPYTKGNGIQPTVHIARPHVIIPVFPGTNCEYDSARAWERAGATAETIVVRNLTPAAVEETVDALVAGIKRSQIIMLPGGFSGGDEPDGSGKFIAAMFRNPRIKEEVMELLQKRDGLMIGICNGFQALIKLGLVPYGEIRDLSENSPTLTHNMIGRHASCMVETRVISNLSPWFNNVKVGDVHTIAISHGEGRFVADAETVKKLQQNGQIATQYVDAAGNPSLDIAFNPNGSVDAIEGITSPDGRVLGKMGHSERIGASVAQNVPGDKDQQLFEAGVRYYK